MVRSSNGRSIRGASPRLARRRDVRRLEILRAAARHFRRRGFAATGMREIAEAADLSAANLYHYFRSKDEILYYCQDRALDRMLAALVEARRATRNSQPATRILESVLASHIRIVLDDVEGAAAHLELPALDPVRRARIVAKRDKYERAVRAMLDKGVRRGDLVAGDSATVVRAMLGAANWTATWFDPAGPRSVDDVATTIAAFLVRGVTA